MKFKTVKRNPEAIQMTTTSAKDIISPCLFLPNLTNPKRRQITKQLAVTFRSPDLLYLVHADTSLI